MILSQRRKAELLIDDAGAWVQLAAVVGWLWYAHIVQALFPGILAFFGPAVWGAVVSVPAQAGATAAAI
jgi:hypothetical protein